MALTFGQLLAGAGRVASGMREEQEAQRVAQLNEMRLQEARRLEADRIRQRNALLAQQQQQMQPLEFRPGLDISQIQRQTQEERLRGYRTDAAETVRRQAQEAQQQAAQRQAAEQAEQPVEAERAGLVAPSISRQVERLRQGPAGIVAATLTAPYENLFATPAYYAAATGSAIGRPIARFGGDVLRQIVSPGEQAEPVEEEQAGVTPPERQPTAAPTNLATSADEAINRVLEREGGFVDDPADRGGRTNFGISQRAYPDLDIANLTRDEAARIYKRDYWDFIGADDLPENIREIAFDTAVNQGPGFARRALIRSEGDPQRYLDLREERYREIVERDPSQERFLTGWLNRLNEFRTDLEAPRQVATVVDGVDVEAQETVAQPEYTAELEAPEPEPQTRQAGVSEETNKILGNDSFYLANPNTITREMRTVMNQRQNLARMAEIYRQGRMGEQYAQALAGLQELDNNLLFLQGMEGITELTQFRDPRRLSAVMRNVTGANIDYQPRDDGRYNLVRYNPDGSFNVVREGLTPQEISNDARLRVSAKAREQAAELAADRARRDVELEYFRKQENAKALNEMAKAWQQGQMDLAKEIAGNAGGSLQETTEGLAFTATLPTGQTVVSLYEEGREGKNRWFLPDVDEVAPRFVPVDTPISTGLVRTLDAILPEEVQTLQTWNE